MAHAPTATNAAWHNEICPLVHTNRAREEKMITTTNPAIHTGRCVPTTAGTAISAARPTAAITAVVLRARGWTSGTRLRRLARRLGNRAAGINNNTTNSTRNGIAGGTPLNGWCVRYFVAKLAAT